MIPKASQRGTGGELATHLLNAEHNELIEIIQIRGAVATDLHGAFEEWELQAHHLTRCENYLYSLSINPDYTRTDFTREQIFDYIEKAEWAIGLTDQPRAIVFHVKEGREHCHVVWSRIKADEGKAVHIGYDRLALMEVSRAHAKEHGYELPDGYSKQSGSRQHTLYERDQRSQTGLTPDDHAKMVTQAWQISDSPAAFINALEERGYLLATGKRPYVLVDVYGFPHALARLIDDRSVRSKDIEAFLAKQYPTHALPSVDEAKKMVAHLSDVKAAAQEAEQRAEELYEQRTRHARKREGLTARQNRLAVRQKEKRDALESRQREQRQRMKSKFLAERKSVQDERAAKDTKSVAKFWNMLPGMNALRRQFHRYQDKKRLSEFKKDWKENLNKQAHRREDLKQIQILQKRALEKEDRALTKVENRERRTLEKKLARQYRTAMRGGRKKMPSIVRDPDQQIANKGAISIQYNTASGQRTKVRHKKQLSKVFGDAAGRKDGEDGKGTDEQGLETRRIKKPRRPRRRRERDPGKER